jgi:NAD(P)-dependent dehydrogenase (short-subunit alcohol dehydrogenase family)
MANGAVTSMVRTLAVELAPVRVNAIHPGAVGDSPAVSEMPPALIEAPSGPGEFHPEPLTDSGLDTLASSGSCHRTKAAAFR